MNPEQRPIQKREVTPKQVLDVAEELLGEDSENFSYISLILEEIEKEPHLSERRIGEARDNILKLIILGRTQRKLQDGEMGQYMDRLGYTKNEALEKLTELSEELFGGDALKERQSMH